MAACRYHCDSLFHVFLLYANIVYYRFFNDFITLPTVMQAGTNGGQLGDSAFSLMRWTDMFYFLDTIILIVLAVRMKRQQQTSTTVPVQKQNRLDSFLCPLF